jgi:hypothetical protein
MRGQFMNSMVCGWLGTAEVRRSYWMRRDDGGVRQLRVSNMALQCGECKNSGMREFVFSTMPTSFGSGPGVVGPRVSTIRGIQPGRRSAVRSKNPFVGPR